MTKITTLVLSIGLIAFAAGCGDDGDSSAARGEEGAAPEKEAVAVEKDDEASPNEADATEKDAAIEKEGTAIVLGDSQFGEMVFDENQQAIYVFERDGNGESNCYGECAVAWPPVVTDGEPVAGDGLDSSLLGTTDRRDGSTQVTYDGRPLYYYVDEGPGEVRCHNVDLNGGLWWVIGPDGEPLA